MATIMDTGNVAEINNLGPDDEIAAMEATTEETGNPMEFHVQMTGHTFRDMESLIVNAAAQQIVGWHANGNAVNKLTEAERLSAIKYHPTIKAFAEPHIRLAEQEAALKEGK